MTWVFWLYAAGGLCWTAWVVAYATRSPWYRSPQGWAAFGAWTALALTLDLAAIYRMVPLPHLLAVVLAAVVLSAVAVAGLVQLIYGLHLQRQDDDEPHRRATDHR